MKVHVLFFARSREVTNESEVDIDLDDGSTTEALTTVLLERYPLLAEVFDTSVLALNQEYLGVGEHALLKDGDELAIIPPISGG